MAPYKGVILDLGDVLFPWDPKTLTRIPFKTFRAIITGTLWDQYEKGQITAEEFYRLAGEEFGTPSEDIAAAFLESVEAMARAPSKEVLALLHEFKSQGLRLFIMSNIGKLDLQRFREAEYPWDLFDRIFTSSELGIRKPDPAYYDYVLKEINLDPSEVIFMDDRIENVTAAQKIGITGVHFDDVDESCRRLRELVHGRAQG